jgi:ADP-ribose pyrophosphatase
MNAQNSEIIGAGRRTRLINDNGWEYVERLNISGIVCIVPVTQKGNIVMVRQFRKPLQKDVIELPAGLAGDVIGRENETLAQAAHRELLEETGYQAPDMIFLTQGPPSSGLTSEIITFYLAPNVTKVAPGGGDRSENITVYEIPLEQVHIWLQKIVENGNILVDPKIYSGLYFVMHHRTKT